MNRRKEPTLDLRKLEATEIELAEDMPYPFRHPARIGVQGMTNSGKSVFISRFIQDLSSMLSVKIEGVYYCHPDIDYVAENRAGHIASMQRSCKDQGITFTEIRSGLPEFIADLKKNSNPRVVILDDLEERIFNERIFIHLFNAVSHHFSCTVLFCLHNYYYQGPTAKHVKRAVSDWILWPLGVNPTTLRSISKELLDNSFYLELIARFLADTFDHTADQYVYIDKNPNKALRPDEKKLFGIRTNLFKDEKGVRTVIYFTFEE
jgi:hypothetical protein